MKIVVAVLLALIGLAMFASSLRMSAYKDEQQFDDRYLALDIGDSDKYWKLRDEMLTSKYALQDYGLTLVCLALVFPLLTGRIEVRSPKHRASVMALGVGLPFITFGAGWFDLKQMMTRQEAPHWADSYGIPLMGLVMVFVFLCVWSALHLTYLKFGYTKAPLRTAITHRKDSWLLLVSAITVALVVYAMALGVYWYALPGLLWLYFYLSLAAGKPANLRPAHGA